MSKKRYVDTRFWEDGFVSELDPIEKLLFLYILTNPLTDLCGAYEVPLKRVAFDTGIDREMVVKIFGRFEDSGKILYRDGWVYVKNFAKHQAVNPKIMMGMRRSLNACPDWVKDRLCIDYPSLRKAIALKPKPKLKPKPEPKEESVDSVECAPPPAAPAAATAKQTNEEFLAGLKASSAYAHVDIDLEREKARVWCQTNNKQLTRRFFVNWINRVDKPLKENGNGTHLNGNGARNGRKRTDQEALAESAEFYANYPG